MTFTPKQQAAHCRELAGILENLPSEDKYDHGLYVTNRISCGTVACALGWAAVRGIGGLYMNGHYPHLNGERGPMESGDVVFGPQAYSTIFDIGRPNRNACERDQDLNARQVSISRLYAQADMLDPPSDEVQ